MSEMTYYYGVVSATIHCQNCDWETESYKNGQAIAKKHAIKYGHKVMGELVIAFGYDGSHRNLAEIEKVSNATESN